MPDPVLLPVTLIEGTVEVSLSPIPTTVAQQRFDVGTTVIYVGTATRGLATSATGWTISRIQLSNGNPTTKQWATDAVWDDRAASIYS